MPKVSHPGKREALAKYKRLYLAYLESDEHNVSAHRESLKDFEKYVLADTSLGITSKTLTSAKYEALEARMRTLFHTRN